MGDFDIDLSFGQIYEKKIEEIFRSKGRIEVKTERDVWKKTGNIAIEISYKGRPSGIASTDADWWFHLLSYKGEIQMALVYPVTKLKGIVIEKIVGGTANVKMGGDDNESEIILLPIRELMP